MNVKILTSIIAAVIVTGIISGVALVPNEEISYIPKRILTLKVDDLSLPQVDASVICDETLASVKQKAPFPVLTPTVMLEGYSFKGAQYVEPSRVHLKYSDSNVCGENAKTLRDGVIEIIAGPLDTAFEAKNGTEFVAKFVENSASTKNVETFVFNGKKAVGFPAGVGKSIVIDENDTIINEGSFDYPATVFVVDDSSKMIYRLNGFVPLEDLVKISESLK